MAELQGADGGGNRREVCSGDNIPRASGVRAYLGATIAGLPTIGRARIAHEGRAWQLTPNAGSAHQLHGGPQGFDSRDWALEKRSDSEVQASLLSADGDQGFPGELSVRVTYRLVDDLGIEMVAEATTTQLTPVCLTNHAYFNLDAQHADVRKHTLQIAAEQFVPVDSELIPLGMLAPVQGTSFDFRQPKTLAQDWLADEQQTHGRGYDHAFLLDPIQPAMERPICTLVAGDGDLGMAMYSSLPSLQLYAGSTWQNPHGMERPTRCAQAWHWNPVPADSPNHPSGRSPRAGCSRGRRTGR